MIDKTNVQVITSTVWPPNVPEMLIHLKQLGLKLPVLEFGGGADPSLLKMGGDELNGLNLNGVKTLASSELPDSDPQKQVIVDFVKRYEAKFKVTPGAEAAASYDAIHILANALKVSGADRLKLRDAIESTKNFVGNTGVFNFTPGNHEGLTKDDLVFYVIKDHKFSVLSLKK